MQGQAAESVHIRTCRSVHPRGSLYSVLILKIRVSMGHRVFKADTFPQQVSHGLGQGHGVPVQLCVGSAQFCREGLISTS